MSRFSLSGTARLLACSYWMNPAVPLVDTGSNAADGGTAVGAVAEAVIKGQRVVMPEDEKAYLFAQHVLAWLKEHRTTGMRAEVPFAWDVRDDTGRELPSKGQRDYSAAADTEVCGTADIVSMGVDEDGAFVWIADWKCHFGGDRVDARDQLAALALAACRTYGVPRAKCVALHVDERGVDDTSERYDLDAFDLDGVAVSIREALANAPSEPRSGPHCTQRFCGAIAACPKTQAGLVQLVPDVALVRKDWRYQPVIESPDHLAWMATVRPMLSKAMKQVDAAMAAYVKDGPVTTSTGDEVYQATRRMPRLNMGALEQLARDKGATDEEIASCFRTSVEPNGVRVSAAKRGRAA